MKKKRKSGSEKALQQAEFERKKHTSEFKRMKYLNKKAEIEAQKANKEHNNLKQTSASKVAKEIANKQSFKKINSKKDVLEVHKKCNNHSFKSNSKYGSIHYKKAVGAFKHIMKDNSSERNVNEWEREYRKEHLKDNIVLGDGKFDNATVEEWIDYCNKQIEKLGANHCYIGKEFTIKVPINENLNWTIKQKQEAMKKIAIEYDKFVKNYKIKRNGKEYNIAGTGKKLFGSIHMNEMGEYHYQVVYENQFVDEKNKRHWGIGIKPTRQDLYEFQKELAKHMEPIIENLGIHTINWKEKLIEKILLGQQLSFNQYQEAQSLGIDLNGYKQDTDKKDKNEITFSKKQVEDAVEKKRQEINKWWKKELKENGIDWVFTEQSIKQNLKNSLNKWKNNNKIVEIKEVEKVKVVKQPQAMKIDEWKILADGKYFNDGKAREYVLKYENNNWNRYWKSLETGEWKKCENLYAKNNLNLNNLIEAELKAIFKFNELQEMKQEQKDFEILKLCREKSYQDLYANRMQTKEQAKTIAKIR